MTDHCIVCKSVLPDKIKRWAIYCTPCYNTGIAFYYASKNK